MSIKITDKMLSIPPYLSTCWSRVTALQMQFLGDVRPMIIHRADADAEFIGDFLAGLVGRQQFEHAPFGRRQLLDCGGLSGGRSGTLAAVD